MGTLTNSLDPEEMLPSTAGPLIRVSFTDPERGRGPDHPEKYRFS